MKEIFADGSHIIQNFTNLVIQLDASYVEQVVKVLAREKQVIRRKTIPLVKVLWNNHGTKEYSVKLRKI